MADTVAGNTELGATKQDIIASLVQRELAAAAKLLPTCWDVSRYAVKGAKSVSFPRFPSGFTVVDRATATAGDATALTATVEKLDLEWNAYIAWIIDQSDLIQATIDAEMEYAARAASAHGRYVDDKIKAALEAAGKPVAGAGDIDRDKVLEMREGLLTRFANLDQLVLAISPDQESAMLKVAEFTQAQIYGSSNVPNGVIGRVYGIEVLVSNNLPVDTFYMYEKGSAVAVAFQKGPSMSTQGANEFGSNSVRTAMDQLFGVKALRLGEQGVLPAESALIMKDAN